MKEVTDKGDKMTKTERKPLRKTDRWASDIGRNGDNKPIKICPECHHDVVWVESSKTGKFYLADVFHYDTAGGNQRIVYNAGRPHYKTCKEHQGRSPEWDLYFKKERNTVAFIKATQALISAGKSDEAEALAAQFEATGEVN
jgi:hypothetical protein